MPDLDDMPIAPRDRDPSSGAVAVWAVAGLALVLGYVLLLILLSPAP